MPSLIRTARTTGLLYLALAISGGVGFLLIRPRLFAEGDAAVTLANLVAQPSLARAGIAFELLLVITQALAAVWFYRLFRTAEAFAAGCIAAFGLVNAVAILGSAALLSAALGTALNPVDGAPAAPHLMYVVGGSLWGVANVFFGLWLIPMGWCVLRSQWMPRPLGWILIVGGAFYVVGAFVASLASRPNGAADALLAMPATVGEVWMLGYLIVRGVRRGADSVTGDSPVESPVAGAGRVQPAQVGP
jgi:hypothetical protein